jgi:hypothetical protein
MTRKAETTAEMGGLNARGRKHVFECRGSERPFACRALYGMNDPDR